MMKCMSSQQCINNFFYEGVLIFLFCFLISNYKSQKMNCIERNFISSKFYNSSNGMKNSQRNVISMHTKKQWNQQYLNTQFNYKEVLTKFYYCNICCNSNKNQITAYNGKKYRFESSLTIDQFVADLTDLIGSMSVGKNENNMFKDSIIHR